MGKNGFTTAPEIGSHRYPKIMGALKKISPASNMGIFFFWGGGGGVVSILKFFRGVSHMALFLNGAQDELLFFSLGRGDRQSPKKLLGSWMIH